MIEHEFTYTETLAHILRISGVQFAVEGITEQEGEDGDELDRVREYIKNQYYK